jgi:GTP-binding protein
MTSRSSSLIPGASVKGEQGIDAYMAEQSRLAIHEADIVLFLVDARAGLTPADQEIAAELRVLSKQVHLVVNKIDGVHEDAALADFYQLGMGELFGIAASHGRGIHGMMQDVLVAFPPDEVEVENAETGRQNRHCRSPQCRQVHPGQSFVG